MDTKTFMDLNGISMFIVRGEEPTGTIGFKASIHAIFSCKSSSISKSRNIEDKRELTIKESLQMKQNAAKYKDELCIKKDTEKYEFKNGNTARREYGNTPNGNKLNGRWVLRDDEGNFIDFDKYRNDLFERNTRKLHQ